MKTSRRVSVDVGEIGSKAMPRAVGDRYACGQCGAALVYEKACPCCKSAGDHVEMCCGEPMAKVDS